MKLVQLIYISTATQQHDEVALKDIMESASQKNEPESVTGMLLYCDGNFMQVLEGESEAVEATYSRISRDLSHKDIIEVLRQPVTQRSFGHWSMGFRAIRPSELLSRPAYAPFFDGGFVAANLGAQPSLALEMLQDFGLSDREIRLS